MSAALELSKWVKVSDVQAQLDVGRSTAYAMLREAAGGAGRGALRVRLVQQPLRPVAAGTKRRA